MRKELTPENIRDYFKFDIAMPDIDLENDDYWVRQKCLVDKACKACDWTVNNSVGSWGLWMDSSMYMFRFELREDCDILSLHWSSL